MLIYQNVKLLRYSFSSRIKFDNTSAQFCGKLKPISIFMLINNIAQYGKVRIRSESNLCTFILKMSLMSFYSAGLNNIYNRHLFCLVYWSLGSCKYTVGENKYIRATDTLTNYRRRMFLVLNDCK